MSTLLPFHKTILEAVHDPGSNDLLILARGLGLRRIICTMMQIYDSPQNLILLVNATQEEESAIGEELGIMGCRKPGLRVVSYETGKKDRQELYKQGGLISVTSRILVVDMLQNDIPTKLITGMLILHAERVTALALEAFIIRLYREKNKNGFVKAFTDQPEHITSGLSPLKNIMKELQLRKVHIYPRFQEDIKKSLERRHADVVELSQGLTDLMGDIHSAIIQCMTITLSELKRSNTTLDLDDFNVENAYFNSFDIIVRRQLDPVWHKVGPKTKQLVNDLGTLRRLLYFLLTYDSLQFHTYLESIIASNTTSVYGNAKQHQSPWLLTDAANIIFQAAQRRCYTKSSTSKRIVQPVIDVDDEDAWDALDEVEGVPIISRADKGKLKESDDRPGWLPEGIDPVLEELPKWNLLAEILQEAEEEIIRLEATKNSSSAGNKMTNTILIMTSSTPTCILLTEYLSSIDHNAPSGSKGRSMMMQKLRLYLWWKGKSGEKKATQSAKIAVQQHRPNEAEWISEALKKKDAERLARSQNRRRVRGGAPAATASAGQNGAHKPKPEEPILIDDIFEDFAALSEFLATQGSDITSVEWAGGDLGLLDSQFGALETEFDAYYGLLPTEQTILVRAYSDDTDDRMLVEIQPTFIVMFEPNMEFIRRIEVYRSSSPGVAVRVYHMVYGNSCEEHKYLAGIRREKESFERLIKERGSMLLPLFEERREGAGASNTLIKTISSRLAGGRKELNKEPSRVIVDMREFLSTLPSLLHASGLLVIPATLTVGDYILTPDICVERKSIPDLKSSFNSGRLYTQCELMSVHYKHPMLLIEFEEDKAFSLDIVPKSYDKPTSKHSSKKALGGPPDTDYTSIQSKIVLLTLTFPRLRIIWSSSPYATAEIFNDLKQSNAEPDTARAIAIGADDDPDPGAGINASAEELLRCLPGITVKNVKYVMNKVRNVKELCEMRLPQVQEILGVEPGKACYEFMHRGDRQ